MKRSCVLNVFEKLKERNPFPKSYNFEIFLKFFCFYSLPITEDYVQAKLHFTYFQAGESFFSFDLGINFIQGTVSLQIKLGYSSLEAS
jgi:hypothetical protein